MNYVFAGSDKTAADVLRSLIDFRPPSLVITKEDAPFGRKRELKATEVSEVAVENGIPLVKANDPSLALDQIRSAEASRGIVVSYGAILKGEVLDSLDWYNLHFSLLPNLRGAAPVQRAIMAGQTPTGVTLFKIDKGMDTGPVYAQLEVDISGLSTAEALPKMVESSLPLLYRLLQDVNPVVSQQQGESSFAKKLSRDECRLVFSDEAEILQRVVLAANPEPMAWTEFKGEPFRVLRAKASGIRVPADDSTVGLVEKVGGKIYVVCGGSTRLELLEVQPFSKKPMRAQDWFNGVGEAVLGH